MIRMGLVCSSGGSVAGAAIRILRQQGRAIEVALVTDRPCGAEAMARELGLPHRRIAFESREQFSQESARWLYDDQRMNWSCLLFLRLVSRDLFDRAPCFNLHPSLLPAFRGFGALEKARASGARFFGATAHRVDESVDGGAIVGQIVTPMPMNVSLATIQRLSFAQKLYLLLVLTERLAGGGESEPRTTCAGGRHLVSPPIADPALERAFVAYVNQEGIPWGT